MLRRLKSRAIGKATTGIIILVILIVGGVAGYVALSSRAPSSTTGTTTSSSGSTSSTTSSQGNPVPNPSVFIEENTVQPGPGGLDPAETWDYSDMWLINVYENLVHWNGSNPNEFVPWLATSWTIAPNASQITFQLRQGVKFADGTPFNATAVKFSYDRAVLMNHEDGPQFLLYLLGIKGAPEYYNAETIKNTNMSEVNAYLSAGGVKVLGTYTVEFNLEHPYPSGAMLGTFAWESGGSIVSPSYVIKHCPGTSETPGVTPGFDCTWMQTHMMGTGPFMLNSYTPSSEIIFDRNPLYWGTPAHTGIAKLHQYIVKYVKDVATAEVDLLTGQADSISLPTSNAFDLINQQVYQQNGSVIPTHQGLRIWVAPTNTIAHMLMDPRIAPFNNINFRKAMAYAFPYQQFIQNVSNGFAIKLNDYLPPGMFGYNASITGYNYNPTLAKQLFTEAGYQGNVTLIVGNNDATNIEAAVLYKSSVESIDPSLTVNIKEVDTPTALNMFHQYQIPVDIGCCWVPDIADGSETLNNWASPQGFYGLTTEFNNATVTQWLNEAGSSLNQTLRLELYSRVQESMLSYAGVIPLYSPDAIQVERTWVLPANSPIGRGVYNPQQGDGSGGEAGGYVAYYINKANYTSSSIAVDIMPGMGANPFMVTHGLPLAMMGVFAVATAEYPKVAESFGRWGAGARTRVRRSIRGAKADSGEDGDSDVDGLSSVSAEAT